MAKIDGFLQTPDPKHSRATAASSLARAFRIESQNGTQETGFKHGRVRERERKGLCFLPDRVCFSNDCLEPDPLQGLLNRSRSVRKKEKGRKAQLSSVFSWRPLAIDSPAYTRPWTLKGKMRCLLPCPFLFLWDKSLVVRLTQTAR